MWFLMVRQNWEHLYEFLPPIVEAMQSEEDGEEFIRWVCEKLEQKDLFLFGMWEKATREFIGEVNLRIQTGTYQASSWAIFWSGKPRAKDMPPRQHALHFAFVPISVNRVDLQCRADNKASQRVAERCGFQLEGRQRFRRRKKNSDLVDRLWYGLLRSEWSGFIIQGI